MKERVGEVELGRRGKEEAPHLPALVREGEAGEGN